MAASGGTPKGGQARINSSPLSWQQQSPTLMNYSALSGGLSVDALAGPTLFTPTPPVSSSSAQANTVQTALTGGGTEVASSEQQNTLSNTTWLQSGSGGSNIWGNPVVSAGKSEEHEISSNTVQNVNNSNYSPLHSNTLNDFIHTGKQISPPLVHDSYSGEMTHTTQGEVKMTEMTEPYQLSTALKNDNVTQIGKPIHVFAEPLPSNTNKDSIAPAHSENKHHSTFAETSCSLETAKSQGDGIVSSPQIRKLTPSSPYIVPPLVAHWFFLKGGKIWTPFSYKDSRNLELAFSKGGHDIVLTDGGRYDVNLKTSLKHSIYWIEDPCFVQRCTWFCKGEGESKLIPYSNEIAEILEKEYQRVAATSSWNQKIKLPSGDIVQIHNANIIVYYKEGADWTGEDSALRPNIVRRGIGDIKDEIPEGEPDQVDHLVFIVHGIGPVADLEFRNIVECVDDMRQLSLNLMNSPTFSKGAKTGRVEFLPVIWYGSIHDDKTGVDGQLKSISLPSANKLRDFTNNTLTDILFFTSPMYCQEISDTVVNEMNRMLSLFKSRNPTFQGHTSVCGHSLGSCILFDILAHQDDRQSVDQEDGNENDNFEVYEEPFEDLEQDLSSEPLTRLPASSAADANSVRENQNMVLEDRPHLPEIEDVLTKLGLLNLSTKFKEEQIDTETLIMCTDADIKDLGIPLGPRKKLSGFIKEKKVEIAKASTKNVQGVQEASRTLPSSGREPVRTKGTQTLISVRKQGNDPNSVTVPYFKGQPGTGQPCVTYAKLSFEPDHMFALGSPIGLFLTTRGIQSDHLGLDFRLPTCKNFFNIFHPYDPVAYRLEPLINTEAMFPPILIPHHKGRKRFHLEIKDNLTRVSANLKQGFIDAVRNTWSSLNEFARAHKHEATLEIGDEASESLGSNADSQDGSLDESFDDDQTSPVKMVNLGKLNCGRRIDYVLQEKPFEILNEYLFALSSHTTYWKSEDTVLLMVKEIYNVKQKMEAE